MEFILLALIFILCLVFLVLFIQKHKACNAEILKNAVTKNELNDSLEVERKSNEIINTLSNELEKERSQVNDLRRETILNATELAELKKRIADLSKYQEIINIEAEIQRKVKQSNNIIESANREAESIKNQAKEHLRLVESSVSDQTEKAELALKLANIQAKDIIQLAKSSAETIAGDAYKVLEQQSQIEAIVIAMKNTIEGYGDQYLLPQYSLLDALGDAYTHEAAGQALIEARKNIRHLIKNNVAGSSAYMDVNRKKTAINFIVDAFNGKVDSILTNIKSDNYGTLKKQVEDAYVLVNQHGIVFNDTKITPLYLAARLDELKWAVAVVTLRDIEREEQRRIKEIIREEEKARRDYERAIKDAAKEEDVIKRAMEKAQAEIAKATDAQRTIFEAQLAELQSKLTEAQAKNERALSMAQQTRAGHVYVISNIGSFGEAVFKIGMTRRLEPMDRVKELGDASVPFTFDVHAMMYSEDAPGLERELHRRFNLQRMNMVNFRKEFFRVDLQQIKTCISDLTGSELLKQEPQFTLTAAAQEYRESQAVTAMSTEDRYSHLSRLLKLELLAPIEELSEAM